MAFRKNINEIFGTVLVLTALLSTASAVDCFGKSFHCVNSTHFMICVDLGGGVSQSIDDFLIPCPPPTVCQGNNHFECEFPAVTTPSTTISNAMSDTTEPWEEIVVTTNSTPKNTSTTKEYSEKYMNTVSITSVAEDNLTTDTTIDVTTEAFFLSDVNNNANVTEIMPISPSYEVTTRVEGVTEIVSDKITAATEVTTGTSQIIPLHKIQNVTDKTTVANVTLSFSDKEPTATLNSNDISVQNDSVREVRNITAPSQPDNVTSSNIISDIVTAGSSMRNTSTRTERPSTSVTDESVVTGGNLMVTTTQTLVSTNEFQNLTSIDVQTTTVAPAIIQNTLDKKQFQTTGFEENVTTESVKNEQSNGLPPDVMQNVQTQLPITTYQSTVITATDMHMKNEVTVETTIASEEPTTKTYKVNQSTTDHTTESPLTISIARSLDIQKSNKSEQVPTNLADEAIVYQGSEQSTKSIIISPNNIDVTFSDKEPTATLNSNDISVQNDSVREVRNITATSQPDNITSRNIISDIVTPGPSIKNTSTRTERPSTSVTDESVVTGGNLMVTTTQTLVSTDELQNFTSIDVQTTAVVPAIIQNTLDEKQFQTTGFEENVTTESVKIEQSNGLLPDVMQNVQTQVPIITYQSTVITPTDIHMKNEVTVETTIASEEPTTKTYEVNQSITDHTTESPLTISIARSLDIQKSNKSEQVPTKLTDEAIVYQGNEQSTKSIIISPNNIDVTTEQSIVISTETPKLLVTEHLKINKVIAVIEPVQKLIETGTESPKISNKILVTAPDITLEKTSDLITEMQQKQGNKQIIIKNNTTTTVNESAAGVSVSHIGAQQPIDEVQPSNDNIQSLTTDNAAFTQNPSEFSTEIPKLLFIEQNKTSKNNSGIEKVQKLNDSNSESPKSSNKGITNDPDITTTTTEKLSDLATETQQKQRNEQIIIPKNITTAGNQAAVISKEAHNTIEKGIQQSKFSSQSLATDSDTPLKVNKNSPVAGNVVSTEANTLTVEAQIPIHNGVQQGNISANSSPDENVNTFTTITQQSVYLSTGLLTTIRSDTDITTEKSGIYTTVKSEPRNQITEEEKSIFVGAENTSTNKNDLAFDNYTTNKQTADFTTEAQISIHSEQPIAGTRSTAADTVAKNSVFSIEIQKPANMSTPQSITKSIDIDVNVEKTIFSTITTPKFISGSTELPVTIKNDLATDSKVITDTEIDSGTGTSNPTVQIPEEVTLSLSDHNITKEKQKEEIFTTDTVSFAVITTEAVAMQNVSVTEQPIFTTLEDSIVWSTTPSNIGKFQNNITSNAEANRIIVAVSINKTTAATTTEPTTIKSVEGKTKDETIIFTSDIKASDSDMVNDSLVNTVQVINNAADEKTNQNLPKAMAGTVASLLPITEKIETIKKYNETVTEKSTPNLNNVYQLITNIDDTDITSVVTTDKTFNIINEVKYFTPNTVKPTQSTKGAVEIIDKNQHTTESNFVDTETAFTTENIKVQNNVVVSDVGLSNNAFIKGDTRKTAKVNSEPHVTERVILIPVENIGDQSPTIETLITNDSGSISTSNTNLVINSKDLNPQGVKNQLINTDTVYSEQITGTATVTSETTATESPTTIPSLNSNNESSPKDKDLTSNNQVTTEITNTMIENTILNENGNIYKTLTSLNIQDNSYVSLTTKEATNSQDNTANNKIIKSTTIYENRAQETRSINFPNNEPYFISIPGVIQSTETAFKQESPTVGGIDYESQVSTKNEMDQPVKITTQIFSTRQPVQSIEPNKIENADKLLPHPLSSPLDSTNEEVRPVTGSSTSFRIKNDEYVNSKGIYSVINNGSTQLLQMENADGVTTQAIPIVKTNDNSPSSPHDSLSVADDLHKTKYPASISKIQIIQPETSLNITSVTKEDTFLNSGNVMTSTAVPVTDNKTEFSIKEGLRNVNKAIQTYFNTPSGTATPGNQGSIIEKGNGVLKPNPTTSDYSTKTSSSVFNTESSLYEPKDNYDSRVNKSGPVPTVTTVQPPVTDTEANKDIVKVNTNLNKFLISTTLPMSVYNINKSILISSQDAKISETKTLQEPYNSATYNPRKNVASAINNYQYITEKSGTSSSFKSSGGIVNTSPESTVSSQRTGNAFKTDVKSLSGQNNEKNVVNSNEFQYNSSPTHSTDIKSSNNIPNTANQITFKSQLHPRIATSQVTEKVAFPTNTIKNVNSDIKENKAENNSTFGHLSITVTPSKNESQDNNKNGLSLSQNAINTTKFNTQSYWKSPKQTTNSTKHNLAHVEPLTPKQNKIHSVTTASQAPIEKITPRPVLPIATTENPKKQISTPANFSCINGIRGRYSDKGDCRKFYICIGNSQPIVGNCPVNTVFSDISKLCTKNLSHCIRDGEFKCPSAGRFSELIKDNFYYICVNYKNHLYRFKFQCQKGFTLNRTTIKCEENRETVSNQSVSTSLSENSNDKSIKRSSSISTSSSSSSTSRSMSTSSDSSISSSMSTNSDSSMSTSSDSSSSSSMSTSSDSSSSSSISSSSDNSSSSSNNDSSSSGDSNSSSSKDNSSGNNDSSSTKSKEKKESKEKPEGKEGDEEDEVFECEKEGKFPVRNECKRYYLCKKNGKSEFRRKIKKCESGEVFHKGKKNNKNSSESDSESDGDRRPSNRRQRKEKPEDKEDEDDDQEVCDCESEGKFPVSVTRNRSKQENRGSKDNPEGKERTEEVFECEKEGKFPIRNDCKRYYLCKKNRKFGYRRKIKKCDSDEVFHKSKKKCVDADSYEC